MSIKKALLACVSFVSFVMFSEVFLRFCLLTHGGQYFADVSGTGFQELLFSTVRV